ncbi:2153_t:CDS:2, partial [Funneliformis geosporum]
INTLVIPQSSLQETSTAQNSSNSDKYFYFLMIGSHSHSANIKHRKDRQDSVRSQLFLKIRKKIENVIREEHEVNEKSLSIARENKFPKEKVYQI